MVPSRPSGGKAGVAASPGPPVSSVGMSIRIEVSARSGEADPASAAALRALSSRLSGLKTARLDTIYLVDGLSKAEARRVAPLLFCDGVVETFEVDPASPGGTWLEIAKRPGVMDPVAQTALAALAASGSRATAVRVVRRLAVTGRVSAEALEEAAYATLANATVEQILSGRRVEKASEAAPAYRLTVLHVPLRELGSEALTVLSKRERLALSAEEMAAVRDHFRRERRDPTDLELLTVAQTWSEHCVHKTFRGEVRMEAEGRRIPNLLKATVFEATRIIRRRLGPKDFCVSVFSDNAGVIRFDAKSHLAVKVETHNHPSALEPYGGAGTGVGGVIRDILGVGMGAWPFANLDVFCFGMPGQKRLAPGVLPPERVLSGVVSGVRDYGNRMGIPTVNGSIAFHPRYAANPLVYCGTLGLLPIHQVEKTVRKGDLVVVAGGRTGRDGIGGATFSSDALDKASAKVSSGAVQIGNAIMERRVLDAQMRARDAGLYRSVTDCGAGGLSSAVGEMGAETGAEVSLEKVPLKYEGLSYAEIWLSEAQERMVFAVPPEKAEAFVKCFADEGVEATVLGRFTGDGMLKITYAGTEVGRMPMRFLHDGRPPFSGMAKAPPVAKPKIPKPAPKDLGAALLKLLAHPTVASKEAVVRQYDHEVQGQTVGKPFVGNAGPADAAVLTPVLGSKKAVVLAHGLGYRLGDPDPYQMAVQAVDEAMRNAVCAGGDPAYTALLDNFCWGSCSDPEQLWKLTRAAEGCRDAAVAFLAPFVSGKDSLNNTYAEGRTLRHIPPTLLVTAVSVIEDAAKSLSMDLKKAGNPVYLVGPRTSGMTGSLAAEVLGVDDGVVPPWNADLAPRLYAAVHRTGVAGLIASCHDLSDGGLLVAAAEAALAGRLGLALSLSGMDGVDLFQEGPSRLLVEVPKAKAVAFEKTMMGLPFLKVGEVQEAPRLVVQNPKGGRVMELGLDQIEKAWRGALPAALGIAVEG